MKFTTFAIALAAAPSVNAFVQNPNPRVKTALPGYLDNLVAVLAPPKKGITNYLDGVATAPARVGGAGIGNYLDSINKECDGGQPTTKCAEAITDYMGALTTGDAPASSAAAGAKAIGSYLDNLASQASSHHGGAGIPSYLTTVPTAPARAGGAGIPVYLNVLNGANGSSSPAQSAPAVKVSKSQHYYLVGLTKGHESTWWRKFAVGIDLSFIDQDQPFFLNQ